MFRVLVISDSHGKNENLREAVEDAGKIDVMIHLGDFCCDSHEVTNIAGVPTYMVSGNCDYSSWSVLESINIELGGHKIFAAHGHRYKVEYGTGLFRQEAFSKGCDIAMYGHTHFPRIEEGEGDGPEGITVINPGSISKPRQNGNERSYIIMTIADDGQVSYELKYLPGKVDPWASLEEMKW